MSRTDIHRPLHVLWQDPSMRRHFRVSHHHPKGVCDLEQFLAAFVVDGRQIRTSCSVLWWSERGICSCEMCSMQTAQRKRAHRAVRAGVRRDLQAIARYPAKDRDDDDDPYPRRWNTW